MENQPPGPAYPGNGGKALRLGLLHEKSFFCATLYGKEKIIQKLISLRKFSSSKKFEFKIN